MRIDKLEIFNSHYNFSQSSSLKQIKKANLIDINKDILLELSDEGLEKSNRFNSHDIENADINTETKPLRFQYSESILDKSDDVSSSIEKMCVMTEKYYSLLKEIEDNYGDTDEAQRRKDILNKTFDELMEISAFITSTVLGTPFISIKYSKKASELFQGIKENMQEDILNMFKNIKNYYADNNFSFKGLNDTFINLNNKYISANDLSIYSKDKEILPLFTTIQKDECSKETFDNFVDKVNNISCSSILKDKFIEFLNIISEKYN